MELIVEAGILQHSAISDVAVEEQQVAAQHQVKCLIAKRQAWQSSRYVSDPSSLFIIADEVPEALHTCIDATTRIEQVLHTRQSGFAPGDVRLNLCHQLVKWQPVLGV